MHYTGHRLKSFSSTYVLCNVHGGRSTKGLTMYYVFRPAIVTWRKSLLYAHIQGGRPTFPEYDPFWWDCVPQRKPFPHFRFLVNARAPRLDNYNTGTEFDLYSARLLSLLHQAEVPFETFPATLVDRKTLQILPDQYETFHLLDESPALDEVRTVVNSRGIDKLVLTNDFLQSQKPLVRISQYRSMVLIHRKLKQKFDEWKITGCHYTHVDEYSITKLEEQVFGKKM